MQINIKDSKTCIHCGAKKGDKRTCNMGYGQVNKKHVFPEMPDDRNKLTKLIEEQRSVTFTNYNISDYDSNTTALLEAIIEMVDKLDNKKQNELHGGYDDADYLYAYQKALSDIKQQIQETLLDNIK